MATTKKTTSVKKTATAAAKKAVKTVATKVADAAVTTAVTKAKATTRRVAGKKHVFIFFNCNDNKDVHSMNVRYNNEVFADTASGRKALLAKVEVEVAAGRVNIADRDAVEHDILKGDPTEASSKLQFGDIERMIFMA